MNIPEDIITPRLRLRPQESGDCDFCLSLWCDQENGRYMCDPVLQDADEKYLQAVHTLQDAPDGYYLIAELKETGTPVGTCCLFPDGSGVYDIGYCIHKDHWQKGLGSEMLLSIIRWARQHGAVSLTAQIADDNLASIALARKTGFVPIRETSFKKWGQGTVFNSHIYQLTL